MMTKKKQPPLTQQRQRIRKAKKQENDYMPRKAPKGKYKLKTHRATAKRFKVTGSGKLMRTKIGKGHLRRNTSRRVKAQFSEMQEVKGRNIIKRVKRLAPYLRRYKLNPSS